ncbi:head-tail joining protein [Pelagimonas varians]|uniref:Uncharacterized protein n=1 Tax=Pelagimonas varians TaxID=696760 RepID=A0A238KFK0_9RHOB|nr:hypothetical protein [Pelagimonas varians]PYG32415.1 hypothetical protein C8N36_103164 [Pelagimonas varians]SMX41397.1 hypothetical protein PEV8663_02266 [Pelagimonas varians]
MIEGLDEWAVFTDPNDFGEHVTITRAGQTPVQITALFSAAGVVEADGFQAGVATTEPVLTFGASALPFDPAQDDQVTLSRSHPGFPAGTVLRMAHVQPGGSGQIRAILERM